MNYYSKALITCFKPQILNRKVENPTEYPQRVVRDRVFFPMHKTQTHCVAELVLFGQLKCTSLQLTYITRFIVSFSIEWIFFSSFLLLKFPLFALISFNYFFFAFFCFCCFFFLSNCFPSYQTKRKTEFMTLQQYWWHSWKIAVLLLLELELSRKFLSFFRVRFAAMNELRVQ